MNARSVAALLALEIAGWVAQAATLRGRVLDPNGVAVAGATIRVQLKTSDSLAENKTVQSNAKGEYEVASLHGGSYTVRAEKTSLGEVTFGPFLLGEKDDKSMDLTLKPAATSVDFFDEPKFTVAGVTDHTYVGGHGSDTVKRSAEALTQATASLSGEAVHRTGNDPGKLLLAEEKYREALIYFKQAAQLDPGNARLHHDIATADEGLGDPLEAVHEYQRAAELDPSELNLFDWGTELLLHQALEPAVQVFRQGMRLFPVSSRMLLGAATALYARGEYGQAAQWFFEAVDLNPADPRPYLFLGKVRNAQITETGAFRERMARFAQTQPQSAWANYFYATSLWRQRTDATDVALAARVESLLNEAVRLDPMLGAAYLQLGILYADKQDFPTAIHYYERAIQTDPKMEQAHYRLAQAYRQTGETQKAQAENTLFQQLEKSSAQELARERSELQRFVVTLKSPASN